MLQSWGRSNVRQWLSSKSGCEAAAVSPKKNFQFLLKFTSRFERVAFGMASSSAREKLAETGRAFPIPNAKKRAATHFSRLLRCVRKFVFI